MPKEKSDIDLLYDIYTIPILAVMESELFCHGWMILLRD